MSTYVKHAKNCKIAVQKNHLIPFRHMRTNKRGPAQKNQEDQYERTNIRRPGQENQISGPAQKNQHKKINN